MKKSLYKYIVSYIFKIEVQKCAIITNDKIITEIKQEKLADTNLE